MAQENGDGSRVTYAYDRSGLLVERRGYAAGIDPRTGAPEVVERFAYDASGLLVRAENGDGVVALARDALGRIVSESRDGRTVESRYDARGRGWRGASARGSQPTPTIRSGRWPS